MSFLRSKTIQGLIGIVGTLVVSPDVLAVIPDRYVHVATTIFGVWTALGIRHASAKPIGG
jgi:hypothetical protein